MSRIALVGCTIVAVLFFVCVGYFISHKPTIPESSTAIEKTEPASPSPNSPASTPASVPEAAAKTSAPTEEPVAPAAPPPVKIKPLPSPEVSIPSGTAYAVDSGSFQDRNNADKLAANIPQKYQTTITPVKVHGRLFYRVRTIVPTQADATALAATLAHDQKLQAHISPIQQR